MNRFDTVLKNLFRRQLQSGALAAWTGLKIAEWLPTELPEVRNRHVDLLGRSLSGALIHIEFQAANDPEMALRMLEYALAIFRRYGVFPVQLVIYVGRAPLRMKPRFAQVGLDYVCRIVDIRDLDPGPLLASSKVEDNILAILTRLADRREVVRRVLRNIAAGPAEMKRQAITELLVLAGLRDLRGIIEMEISHMSLLIDMNRHTIFGPIHRKGVQEGLEKGERQILLNQLRRKYGSVPVRFSQKLKAMPSSQLAGVSMRIFDDVTLEELLG